MKNLRVSTYDCIAYQKPLLELGSYDPLLARLRGPKGCDTRIRSAAMTYNCHYHLLHSE